MENKKIFAKDARVAMIGDSITHSGLAVAYLQEYYMTHFPERRVKIYNLGIGGDTSPHSLARLDEMLSVNPTEAVVMFGVNDMGVGYYGATPSEADLASRTARRRTHLEGTVALVNALVERGIAVTLCSAVGRDEHTLGETGTASYGATDALLGMYHDNLAALDGKLKNSVDYITPLQRLQRELSVVGGPSLFAPDRTHPSELGQMMMARILLAAQGLPVSLPTAAEILDGWRERPLPEALKARRRAGLRVRDLHWVYPHQQERTPGMGLSERIAYWQEELKKPELPPYFISMYKNYVDNAAKEDEFFTEYLALTDALYGAPEEEDVKEALRV